MVIDLKAEAINANARYGFRERAKRTRILRNKSEMLHRQAVKLAGWKVDRAHLTVFVTWPSSTRTRDVHNLSLTFKALIDGAIDAGVLDDDSDVYLVGPDPRVERGHSGVERAALVRFEWTPL